MREIKFRAWDKRDVENPPSMSYFDLSEGNMYKRCGNIMQYTGLKDKNGKEIYEGDIMLTGNGNFIIVWNKSRAKFELEWIGAKKAHVKYKGQTYRLPEYKMSLLYDAEIISNIYENLELL